MRRGFRSILSELNKIPMSRDKNLKSDRSHVQYDYCYRHMYGGNDNDKTDQNSTVSAKNARGPVGDTDVRCRAALSCDLSTQVLGETPVLAGGGTRSQERRPAFDQ